VIEPVALLVTGSTGSTGLITGSTGMMSNNIYFYIKLYIFKNMKKMQKINIYNEKNKNMLIIYEIFSNSIL